MVIKRSTPRTSFYISSAFYQYKRLFVFAVIMLLQPNIFAQGKIAKAPVAAQSNDVRKIITSFFKHQSNVRYIYQVSVNPKATSIAWCSDGPAGSQVIYTSPTSHPDRTFRITADRKKTCNETEPQWSPNGQEVAFLSDAKSPGQLQVYVASATAGTLIKAQLLTKFEGYISHLKWSPDGKYLSVLYVEKASREPSPMAAENRAVGLIDSNINRDIQQIAIISRVTGQTEIITPAGCYIFEYDWSPDSKKFVYTAALPPGDDNWYIAKLYSQSIDSKDTVLLYKPLLQIALPRWSPDGRQVAFIEGLMSDQGGTGGEIFTISSTGHSKPLNLTPKGTSTPAWFAWRPDGNILFTEFTGGSVAINMLNTSNHSTKRLWMADKSIRASNEETSLSVASDKPELNIAFTSSSWSELPEIYCGTVDSLKKMSSLNTGIKDPMPLAENIEWVNEGQRVQGWLLYPSNYDSLKRYPMLVCVHGGPAWITTPTWSAPDFNTTVYAKLGYFVFFPNPRGSYGQGEAFTLANRCDWGFGDLRDIICGVDTVLKKYPVDTSRVGILGWSYGGSMSMFAITQTDKFKAAVSGAGAGDWLSYYGQNAIDKWMLSYFNTSPYNNPDVYARCSAMTYIKNAKTPTLLLVGERDGEAPPPQSFQFWHALKELHVPTQLMVYPDEGHSFFKQEDRIDVSVRTLEWFNKHLLP